MFKTLLVIILSSTQYNCFSLHNVTEFTAVYNSRKNAVIIKWQNNATEIKSFIIQRSVDNKTWVDIAIQTKTPNNKFLSFYFEDKQPLAGENYYRLKSIAVNSKTEFSPVVMVILASPGNGWVMYPVPVKDLLTLEYRGNEAIKGVINVFIMQSSGRIITKLRHSSLNKIIKIPVDNLGKGIYDIRIIVQGDIVWNQRFVK